MPSRTAASSGHTLSFVLSSGTQLTNSGARTTGGLESTASVSNTFTMTDIMTVTETVNVPPASGNPPPYDGLETAAGPYMKVTNISIPASWTPTHTGITETLSHSLSTTSSENPSNFVLAPDIKLTVTLGGSTVSAGVGNQIATAAITGTVNELNSWVTEWNPVTSVPKFDGSDFAKAKSSGYGRENGIFFVEFTIEYGLLPFDVGTWTGSSSTATYKIGIINNFDNDRDQYIEDYKTAYATMTKVPEISERAS